MNEFGESAFPSQATIAKRSGLSERAVRTHLEIAEREGWIEVFQRRRDKQAWFVHEYVATIPERLEHLVKAGEWESDPTYQRPERRSARVDKSGQRPANGAERPERGSATPGTSFHNARHDVPTNSSSNSSSNYPKERAASSTRVVLEKGKREDQERQHKPFPQTQPTQEGLQGRVLKQALRKPSEGWVLSDQELGERITKLWDSNIRDPEQITKTLSQYATHERIRRMLSHRYNVPWVSI